MDYRLSSTGLITCMILLGGCTTVDPQEDYARARDHIRQSTGQVNIQPQDGAIIETRISELLQSGLTADEAAEICLLNNPEFLAQWEEIGMARADLVQAELLSNPTVSLSIQFPTSGGLPNLEAAIAQNIADLWQIPARRSAAKHELNQAILSLAHRATVLAADAREGFYRAVGTANTYDIARENRQVARRLLEMAQARRDAGAGSELDVNLARTADLEAELVVQSARLDRDEDARQLARLLGLTDPINEYSLNDSLPALPADAWDTERLVQLASNHRLDIDAARENVSRTAQAVEVEKSRKFSILELGIGSERDERRDGVVANSTNAITGPNLRLELPIFDQNQARIAKAEFAHRQAQHLLDALERQVIQDVRSAADRARTATQMATLADERFVPLARENHDLSQESYRAGKTSLLAVLQAQRFLLDARKRHILASVDAAIAMAEVERVVGLPADRFATSAAQYDSNTHESQPNEHGDQP